MEPKKNPKVDLAKNSALYFAIGLCRFVFILENGRVQDLRKRICRYWNVDR